MPEKPSGQDRTAAERNIVAYAVSASLRSLLNECHWHSATRRRRRILQSRILFLFIGNSDFGRNKKEHTFTERMSDGCVPGHDDKTMGLKNIKSFDTSLVVQ